MYFSSIEKGLKDVVRFIILNPYQEPLTEKLKKCAFTLNMKDQA